MTPRPALSALIDQASAAYGHGISIMMEAGRRMDAPVTYSSPPTALAEILAKLSRAAEEGRLTLCPHLSLAAPSPAVWLAYAPGRLRCVRCAGESARRTRGTAEDGRCDLCRRAARTLVPVAAQLPAVVDEVSGACLPPVMIQAGLCPGCADLP